MTKGCCVCVRKRPQASANARERSRVSRSVSQSMSQSVTHPWRHFWTCVWSSLLKSANSHRDPGGVVVAKRRAVITFGEDGGDEKGEMREETS